MEKRGKIDPKRNSWWDLCLNTLVKKETQIGLCQWGLHYSKDRLFQMYLKSLVILLEELKLKNYNQNNYYWTHGTHGIHIIHRWLCHMFAEDHVWDSLKLTFHFSHSIFSPNNFGNPTICHPSIWSQDYFSYTFLYIGNLFFFQLCPKLWLLNNYWNSKDTCLSHSSQKNLTYWKNYSFIAFQSTKAN